MGTMCSMTWTVRETDGTKSVSVGEVTISSEQLAKELKKRKQTELTKMINTNLTDLIANWTGDDVFDIDGLEIPVTELGEELNRRVMWFRMDKNGKETVVRSMEEVERKLAKKCGDWSLPKETIICWRWVLIFQGARKDTTSYLMKIREGSAEGVYAVPVDKDSIPDLPAQGLVELGTTKGFRAAGHTALNEVALRVQNGEIVLHYSENFHRLQFDINELSKFDPDRSSWIKGYKVENPNRYAARSAADVRRDLRKVKELYNEGKQAPEALKDSLEIFLDNDLARKVKDFLETTINTLSASNPLHCQIATELEAAFPYGLFSDEQKQRVMWAKLSGLYERDTGLAIHGTTKPGILQPRKNERINIS